MAILKQNLSYNIRPMQDYDISQAIELDREAFPTQWPHPTYSSFKQELRNRLAHYVVAGKPDHVELHTLESSEEHISLWEKFKRFINQDRLPDIVSPSGEYVIGMAGFWLMMNEAHITTIAVREVYRRLGIGERLLISVIDLAIQLNAHIVTLEVRTSNELAQTLYQKYYFYKTGIRHRYYTDNGEDAFIMTTDTLTTSTFQSNYQQLKRAYEQKWNCIIKGNCYMPVNKSFGGQ
jgi:ribosomal-protein-alanine N-acetyltransferase